MRYARVGRHVPMASTICMAATPVVGSSFEFFSFGAIVFFPAHPHPYVAPFSSTGGRPRLLALRLGGPSCPVFDRPNHLPTCLCLLRGVSDGLTVCEHYHQHFGAEGEWRALHNLPDSSFRFPHFMASALHGFLPRACDISNMSILHCTIA